MYDLFVIIITNYKGKYLKKDSGGKSDVVISFRLQLVLSSLNIDRHTLVILANLVRLFYVNTFVLTQTKRSPVQINKNKRTL